MTPSQHPALGEPRIPFNKPFLVGRELDYIARAVHSGQLAGNGRYTRLCEQLLERKFGAQRVMLVHSCTAAIEMAALLLDIGPGDEVVMPSFTFVSTANAFALRGATPVFVDIEPDTLNLDPDAVAGAITERTKAVAVVHYAGVGCAMDRILAATTPRGIAVVEDAAHALNASWCGRALGTVGRLGTFSFHETKNCISGEGGALVVNDPALIERAEILREKGTNRTKFFRGEIDKYTWVDLGSSYLPSEVVSAFLYAQLEEMDRIDARRRQIWARYRDRLADLERRGDLRLPRVPADRADNAHLFHVLTNDAETRQRLARALGERGILAVRHYVPLHSAPQGREIGRVGSSMAVTDDIAERLLRLPLYFELSEADQELVIGAVREFFGA